MLFQPWFKTQDEAKQGVESNGIGLSVSWQIAKNMGGSIKHVNVDSGCQFDFTLNLTQIDVNKEESTT